MTQFVDASFNLVLKLRIMMAFSLLLCTLAVAQASPRQVNDADVSLAHVGTHPTFLAGEIHQAQRSSCLTREKAEAEASDLAVKSAKTFCRKEGFGWRAASVKKMGNLECHPCNGNQFKCAYSELILECRKAEPQLSSLEWFSPNAVLPGN